MVVVGGGKECTQYLNLIFQLVRSPLLFTAYKSDIRHRRRSKGGTDTERGEQTLRKGTDTKGRVYTEASLNLLIKSINFLFYNM